MTRKDSNDTESLERGDIYFLYRPKVRPEDAEAKGAEDMDDVERFYMVLKPQGSARLRLTVIGRKQLPDLGEHERNWGFVDRIVRSADEIEEELNRDIYETKTRGKRVRRARALPGKASMPWSAEDAMCTSPMRWSFRTIPGRCRRR